MLIFGFRSYLRTLGIVTMVCGSCHNPAAHRVVEQVRKFTLFFVPLFPVSKRRSLTCTFCGQASAITAEQAQQYLAGSGSGAGASPSLQKSPPPPVSP
ncbi:MAG: zinc-ribbon domain-containing protein [Jatrophihabitantaceae bacterium]